MKKTTGNCEKEYCKGMLSEYCQNILQIFRKPPKTYRKLHVCFNNIFRLFVHGIKKTFRRFLFIHVQKFIIPYIPEYENSFLFRKSQQISIFYHYAVIHKA